MEDRISAVNGGMLMRRYELTDEQYVLLEPSLPRMQRTDGHLWSDHRRALNGLLGKLRSGTPWRAIPARYGPWSSISDRYRRWCRAGWVTVLLGALRTELDARDQLDWEPWWVYRTPIRASRAAAGARKNGGPPTTRSAAPGAAMAPRCTSYGTGLPLSALLLPGQRMR
ncbi:MAG: hypothetical protein KatS3mg055_3773 [Chloroflexus sp.]|nr:MAG: hypothetical protein KatS3mg055_3773 [Chloroflexus sp.]